MSAARLEALVSFGVTGDLAYRKIFLSPQALLKRDYLNVAVIRVAKAEGRGNR